MTSQHCRLTTCYGIAVHHRYHIISTCVTEPRQVTVQDTLVEMGCKLTEHEWPDHWYFRDERRLKHASIKARRVSSNLEFIEVVRCTATRLAHVAQ